MNYRASLQLVLTLCALLVCSMARSQGPLNPPAGPGETMKSLDQVEPRQPIPSAPYEIKTPGSYYLTANVTGPIDIRADNVTLDLMGFTVYATGGKGVDFPINCRNVTIRNGNVSGAGAYTAVDGRNLVDAGCLFEGLRVYNTYIGIYAGSGCTVRDCEVWGTDYAGIYLNNCAKSVVAGCNIHDNGGIGLLLAGSGALVKNNVVRANKDNYDFAPGNHLELLLCELPEALDWSCTVKLFGRLKCDATGADGITVAADHVTIDLGGHALIGPGAASGFGIKQGSQYRNLRVINGTVSDWQGAEEEAAGIQAMGTGNQFENLLVSLNRWGIYTGDGAKVAGCTFSGNLGDGLHVGNASVVKGCTAVNNGYGIITENGCSVAECAARNNNGYGFVVGYGGAIRNCAASANTAYGFRVLDACAVLNCSAEANGSDGAYVGNGCTLKGCSARDNGGDGFELGADCLLADCGASGNGTAVADGAGVRIGGAGNRIEGANLVGNDIGLAATSADNIIVRNTAGANTVDNWSVVAGNVCYVVQAVKTGVAFSGNSGGTAPGATDPSVNFTY